MQSTVLRAGEYLFREGDPVGSVFVVVAGRLEVVSGASVLRVLGPGAVVGELALLAGSGRSASVRARRDARLLEVGQEDFEALLVEQPGFARELLRETGAQLQESRALAEPEPSPGTTIAIVALEDGLPVDDIVAGVVGELRAAGPSVLLGPGERTDPVERAELLERLERDHDARDPRRARR